MATREGEKARFLDHLWLMVEYWERNERCTSSQEKLEGLMHSLLAALDGEAAMMPPYRLVPARDVEERGWTWRGQPDIAGGLNDEMYSRKPKRHQLPDAMIAR